MIKVKTMKQETHQRFLEICRQQGWKCTSQRLSVYDFICENYTHPTVDVVWSHVKINMPSITRESIYRILNEFASCGIIHRLDHIESARYDGQTGPHGHFICTQCGVIQDFALPKTVAIPQNAFSGDVDHLELRVTGICSTCKNKPTKTKQTN